MRIKVHQLQQALSGATPDAEVDVLELDAQTKVFDIISVDITFGEKPAVSLRIIETADSEIRRKKHA